MIINFTKLSEDAVVPTYAHDGDAGADLYSTVDYTLKAGECALFPTAIAMAIPFGYVGLVHPRSSLAWKGGITVLNAPGTIDYGYTGEIKVMLVNMSQIPYDIKQGDKIAQLVIQKVEKAEFMQTESLDDTERGDGGFGSTGR
jgi:dUTP pyrophosphatase